MALYRGDDLMSFDLLEAPEISTTEYDQRSTGDQISPPICTQANGSPAQVESLQENGNHTLDFVRPMLSGMAEAIQDGKPMVKQTEAIPEANIGRGDSLVKHVVHSLRNLSIEEYLDESCIEMQPGSQADTNLQSDEPSLQAEFETASIPSDYHRNNIHRLEALVIRGTQEISSDEETAELSPTLCPSLDVPIAIASQGTQDHELVLASLPNGRSGATNQPIVRMTQAVYKLYTERISTLEQRLQMASQTSVRSEQATPSRNVLIAGITDNVDELKYSLQESAEQKRRLNKIIRKRDAEIFRKDRENHLLTRRLKSLEGENEQLRDYKVELDRLSHKEQYRDRQASQEDANDMEAQLHAMLAQNAIEIDDYVDQTASLSKTLKQREEMIKILDDKLQNDRKTINELQQTVKHLKENRLLAEDLEKLQIGPQNKTQVVNKQKEIPDDLRKELKEKTFIIDRQNEAHQALCRVLHKRIRIIDKQNIAIQGFHKELQEIRLKMQCPKSVTELLRGAVHVVVPKVATVLPRMVMPCVECIQKNLDCDDQPRCRACAMSDEKCARFRCSLKHKADCPQLPCLFIHDEQGWLVLKEGRPRPIW